METAKIDYDKKHNKLFMAIFIVYWLIFTTAIEYQISNLWTALFSLDEVERGKTLKLSHQLIMSTRLSPFFF